MSLKGVSGVIDYRILEALYRELARQKRSREDMDNIHYQFSEKSHEIYQRMESGEITYDEMRSLQTLVAINLAGGNLPPYTDKPKARFSLLKIVIGLAISFAAWLATLYATIFVIFILGKIPIIGTIIYYPSDATWARNVIPPISAVGAGVFCSKKLCGTAKYFAILIIAMYVIDLVLMFVSQFTWSFFIPAVISVVSAAIAFTSDND